MDIKMKENHLLIGTAGHVDHGKTQLIKALTGIDTDRLKEEKERGISIELGFASLILPDGRSAGIVDVPGHEKFVKQMLAGASGMDIVLLVIAADEGVMPQTKEHLDILDLLNIDKGIIVLTKIDMVDKEWLLMIEQDTKEKLKDSKLKDSPLCKVSSITLEGIPELKQTIIKTLDNTKKRETDLPARMPIDRVFSIQGFGTVVTGTIKEGVFYKGQEIKIEPGDRTAKIRNIQVHGEQVTEVSAGQRGAINLNGLAVKDIDKGSSLVIPGQYTVGQILDVELMNLASEQRSIKQRQRIRLHLGTAEILGRIHLLEQEEIVPGKTQIAQVILEGPVLAAPGDRFVIRYYSPVSTIGGGTVLGITSLKRKRFKEKVIAELQLKAKRSVKELIVKELNYPAAINEIAKVINFSKSEIEQAIKDCLEEEKIVVLSEDGSNLFWDWRAAEKWGREASAEAAEYQKRNPLRGGIGREELKIKISKNLSLKRWQSILGWAADKGFLKITGNLIEALPEIKLPVNMEKKLEDLMAAGEKAGLTPLDLHEAVLSCGIPAAQAREYAGYLTAKGIWAKIDAYYFSVKALDKAKDMLRELLLKKGEITVSEAKEYWQTSRKYAVPLLEHFDTVHFTRREGSIRKLYE